jgi:hypothetical protein
MKRSIYYSVEMRPAWSWEDDLQKSQKVIEARQEMTWTLVKPHFSTGEGTVCPPEMFVNELVISYVTMDRKTIAFIR